MENTTMSPAEEIEFLKMNLLEISNNANFLRVELYKKMEVIAMFEQENHQLQLLKAF